MNRLKLTSRQGHGPGPLRGGDDPAARRVRRLGQEVPRARLLEDEAPVQVLLGGGHGSMESSD